MNDDVNDMFLKNEIFLKSCFSCGNVMMLHESAEKASDTKHLCRQFVSKIICLV